jgi:pectin methylesterase-like acyl-CoA thioesterase
MKFTTVLGILLISVVLSGTNLYVKYSGKPNNFNTIQQAVNKAASLKPSGEGSRVTIHIAPGKYREQIIVNTPYITFVNDEPSKGTVTITWYYGIGYKYFSANSNGYYDANLAKKNPQEILPQNGVPLFKYGIKLNISKLLTSFLKIHLIVI